LSLNPSGRGPPPLREITTSIVMEQEVVIGVANPAGAEPWKRKIQ
jgi:hypothetical protein